MSVEAAILATENWFIGDDRVVKFVVKDPAGVVIDITGWSLAWYLKTTAGGKILITHTTGSGVTITDATNGLCEVAVADTDTSGLDVGGHYHVLKRTNAGVATTLAYGEAVLGLA